MAAGYPMAGFSSAETSPGAGGGGAPGEGRASCLTGSDAPYSLLGRCLKRPNMCHCASQYVEMYQRVSGALRKADF